MGRLLLLATALALSACATQVPEPIREAATVDASIAEVRSNPEQFIGSRVRWGGTIAEVRNLADQTLVQVVARELDDDGEPQVGDRSIGRFVARIDGFLDPAVYTQGRRFTVVGEVAGMRVVEVGEYQYRAPVVEVESYYLWPRETRTARYPRYHDPFWYDPWYPYRPLGFWPYYW